MLKLTEIFSISILSVLVLSFDFTVANYSYAISTGDADGDGIVDYRDNCVEVSNPDQRDTNSSEDDNSSIGGIQHYGNICDPDLNNDGIVDSLDSNIFSLAFGSTPSSPNWNPDADFDGDDDVDIFDSFILHSTYWLEAPGPGREELASVPAMTEWGMIIFITLAGIGSVYYLRKKRTF